MKKPILHAILLALILLFLVSCTTDPGMETGDNTAAPSEAVETKSIAVQAEYIKITAEEAKEMIDRGGEEVVVVDVRTLEEFAAGHIENALLIPDYEVEEKAAVMLPDKEATILVYCRSGRRSEIASRKLISMGYINVYDFGGIIDWKYEIVREQ